MQSPQGLQNKLMVRSEEETLSTGLEEGGNFQVNNSDEPMADSEIGSLVIRVPHRSGLELRKEKVEDHSLRRKRRGF
ncbi:hypothetical protein SDJN03_15883, partial [Cucurbita argyrosperma subsp. sororia]